MIRPIRRQDREQYLEMARLFYHSDAVLAPVPDSHLEKTFELLLTDNPYAMGYILEWEGKTAGYALLARTWSQEAGGEVIWVEEIFLLPEFRGKGLGTDLFRYLEETFRDSVCRFRLEVEDENEGAVRLYKKLGFEFFRYKQMKKEF